MSVSKMAVSLMATLGWDRDLSAVSRPEEGGGVKIIEFKSLYNLFCLSIVCQMLLFISHYHLESIRNEKYMIMTYNKKQTN